MFSALFFKESKLKHQGTHTDSGDASKIQIATSGPVARCRWIQVDTGGYDAGIPWYTNGMLQWCGFVGVQAVQLIPESSVFISFLCPIPLTCLCVLASAVGIVGSLQ